MSTLLEKIQPEEFYASFVRLFNDDLENRPEHVNEMYQADRWWTEFMVHDFLPKVVGDVSRSKGHPEGRLTCLPEKLMRVDLGACDVVPWPWEGDDLNKFQHGLPLYVHLLIEHENGGYPDQEFWKLLHLYAPLKVLVCYLFPSDTQRSYYLKVDYVLGWFQQMHDRVCAFQPHTADDSYLLIIGRRGLEKASEQHWQGYELKAGQEAFRQLQV